MQGNEQCHLSSAVEQALQAESEQSGCQQRHSAQIIAELFLQVLYVLALNLATCPFKEGTPIARNLGESHTKTGSWQD